MQKQFAPVALARLSRRLAAASPARHESSQRMYHGTPRRASCATRATLRQSRSAAALLSQLLTSPLRLHAACRAERGCQGGALRRGVAGGQPRSVPRGGRGEVCLGRVRPRASGCGQRSCCINLLWASCFTELFGVGSPLHARGAAAAAARLARGRARSPGDCPPERSVPVERWRPPGEGEARLPRCAAQTGEGRSGSEVRPRALAAARQLRRPRAAKVRDRSRAMALRELVWGTQGGGKGPSKRTRCCLPCTRRSTRPTALHTRLERVLAALRVARDLFCRGGAGRPSEGSQHPHAQPVQERVPLSSVLPC